MAYWEACDLKVLVPIAATIWAAGIVLGAGAKFRPLQSRLLGWGEGLATHLFLLGRVRGVRQLLLASTKEIVELALLNNCTGFGLLF